MDENISKTGISLLLGCPQESAKGKILRKEANNPILIVPGWGKEAPQILFKFLFIFYFSVIVYRINDNCFSLIFGHAGPLGFGALKTSGDKLGFV